MQHSAGDVHLRHRRFRIGKVLPRQRDRLQARWPRDLNRARTRPGDHDDIEGVEHLDKVIDIDQSPIGRTPRSNPATYTGVFNDIRELFAATPGRQGAGL